MKKSQIDIFGQSFYWKFQAPNKDELSTFVSAQESGDPVPWGNLCSVKMTQILDDILPMMQPSICLLYTSPSPRDTDKSRMPSSA